MPVTPNDVERLRQTVSDQGDATLRSEERRDRLQDELDDSSGDGPAEFTSTHAVYILTTLAVLGIDLLLFAPIAHFMVGNAFPRSPQLAQAAKFLLPACVMVLELALAMRINEAREELQNDERAIVDIDGEAEIAYRNWWWMGGVLVAVMPLLAVSTMVAEVGTLLATESLNTYLEASFLLKAFGLALLAFMSHALFVFGGGHIVEAKEALFSSFRATPEERVQRAEEDVQRQHGELVREFNAYHRALTAYNAGSNRPMAAGPFREGVRQLINRVYGREILQAPPDEDPVGPVAGDGALGPNEPPPVPGAPPEAADADPSDGGQEDEEEAPPSDESDLYEQRRRDDADGTLRP
jgi:hypothetical protein